MVTTKLYGRFTNQAFQIARCISYSLEHDIPYVLPQTTEDATKWKKEFEHLPVLNVNSHNFITIREDQTQPFKNLPAPDGRNIILDGYWQSEFHFGKYKQEIISLMGFEFSKKPGKVAIHVRRGDYLQLPDYHPPISYEYILMSVKYFYELGHRDFQFFSNDMDYVMKLDIRRRYPNCLFSYSVGNSAFQDMQSIASCDHLIGSNSSFSLFSFIINPNPKKICIFPVKWFGDKLSHIYTGDMYPVNALKF